MSVPKIDSFRFFGFCHTRGGVIKQEEWNPVNRNCVLRDGFFERETEAHALRMSVEYFTIMSTFVRTWDFMECQWSFLSSPLWMINDLY